MIRCRFAVPLAVALAACTIPQAPPDGAAAATDATVPLSYDDAVASVTADLAALDALELFEVHGLVYDHAEMPGSCYGACPGEAEAEAAYVGQATRLHRLVATAERADQGEPCYTTAMDVVDSSLQAIDALEIVDIGAMQVAQPQSSANCYNQPCPDDIAAADAENEDRATRIWRIAKASKDL